MNHIHGTRLRKNLAYLINKTMKKLLAICLITLISGVVAAQPSIDYKKDVCSHCNMYIKDKLFSAVAIENDGKVHKFDAIECLVNYLRGQEEGDYKQLLVADYSSKGKLIPAQQAIYLKSKGIASPMGAYLSAYSSLGDAKRVQIEKGGDIYDWEELKTRFRDSRFGLLDHPTHHHKSPDAYAPIGVMGDHLHHKGGFMVSVRYMDMNMEGNLSGSSSVNNMSIFQDFMVAPQLMDMDMYMIGVMYAPSDKLTLMLMQNIVENTMDLESMMGMEFSTASRGLGDMKVSALYSLTNEERSSIHLNTAVSIPLGAIEERDDTPMMENMKLPYPMQLGTGTVDLTIGGTYKGVSGRVSWGVQQLNTIRTGENDQGYRFGNTYELTSWIAYRIAEWSSISARMQGVNMAEIKGMDGDLNPMMAPPANVNNTGYTRARTYFGANFSFGENPIIRDFKLGVEYGLPIYQDVNGIQMEESDTFVAGIRYSL